MRIETPDDWWHAVVTHWSDIVEIFELAGAPLGDHWWSDGINKESSHHPEVFLAFITRLRDERDHRQLARWFNLCWMAAPDSPRIHSWPSWSLFCDLCSETWVFDDNSELEAEVAS